MKSMVVALRGSLQNAVVVWAVLDLTLKQLFCCTNHVLGKARRSFLFLWSTSRTRPFSSPAPSTTTMNRPNTAMAFVRGAALPKTTRTHSACKSPRRRITGSATPPRKIVLYDGVCGLCNGGIQFLLRLDTEKKLKYAALQSGPGLQLLAETGAPDDLSTVVFIDGDNAYTYSDAVLRIGEVLPAPLPFPATLARVLVPRLFRDAFYTNVVANNRYRIFGRSESCTLLQPGYEDRFLQ